MKVSFVIGGCMWDPKDLSSFIFEAEICYLLSLMSTVIVYDA
jgi:hypothetical protein